MVIVRSIYDDHHTCHVTPDTTRFTSTYLSSGAISISEQKKKITTIFYRLLLRVRVVAEDDDDRVFDDDRTAGAELLFDEPDRTVADLLFVLVLLFVTPEFRELLSELPTEFRMLRAASLENIPPEDERERVADADDVRFTACVLLI